VSFFVILPHNAKVTSLWKLMFLWYHYYLEQLPNNSMSLFKNITKNEELVQIIHRIFMIYTKNFKLIIQKITKYSIIWQIIRSIFMGSNALIEVD
jgi:hypothetical protein